MACRCQRHECACRHCPECKLKACRCCCAQLDALASLSPADLAKAHDAHAAALAHLELALAALDTLPTHGFADIIRNPKKALEHAKDTIAAYTPTFVKKRVAASVEAGKNLGNVVNKHSEKAAGAAYRKLVPKSVKTMIEKSRAAKALKNAKEGGKTEYTRANEEHAETKEQFKKEAAAEAAAAAASNAKTSTTESHNIYLI